MQMASLLSQHTTVSIPQAVGTIAMCSTARSHSEPVASRVSIPQAVGTIAMDTIILTYNQTTYIWFQYRKR